MCKFAKIVKIWEKEKKLYIHVNRWERERDLLTSL